MSPTDFYMNLNFNNMVFPNDLKISSNKDTFSPTSKDEGL